MEDVLNKLRTLTVPSEAQRARSLKISRAASAAAALESATEVEWNARYAADPFGDHAEWRTQKDAAIATAWQRYEKLVE